MSVQHTPAPWNVGRAGSVISELPIPGVTGDTGHCDTGYYGGYLIAESIYRIEDARLIAAAPDLLAALSAALEESLTWAANCGLPDNTIGWHEKARAAIGKANGGAA